MKVGLMQKMQVAYRIVRVKACLLNLSFLALARIQHLAKLRYSNLEIQKIHEKVAEEDVAE